VKPIHACQHLYFASIHRPQAEIFFAFHNGFPIIRFIFTIVIQPARIRSKNALWPAADVESPTKISGISYGFSSVISSSLLRGASFQDTNALPHI
jgi:hypothetical protein